MFCQRFTKTKTPSRPYCAREGVRMLGAPTDCAGGRLGDYDTPGPFFRPLASLPPSHPSITHATPSKGRLEGVRFYPKGIPLSRANWGCLKGTIWTTRRWGRREQRSCHEPDPYPGSMPAFPTQGSNIPQSAGGFKSLVHLPKIEWLMKSPPGEDYNY